MRLSTNTIYDAGTSAMLARQDELAKIQLQLATGKRVVVPSDDPPAAAEAVTLTSTDTRLEQYRKNIDSARSRLSLTEGTLARAGSVLQRARELVIAAGSGSLDNGARQTIASELQVQLDELVAAANTSDPGTGGFLFSGSSIHQQPFALVGSNYGYFGDQTQVDVPVSDTLDLRASITGDEVFQRVRIGNGSFATLANASNTGSGVVDNGRVFDPSLATGHGYRIQFAVSAGTTTYDVVDTTTGTTVLSAQPYAQGQTISFDGIQAGFSGAPANGDRFDVVSAVNRNVFDTLRSLIGTLSTPVVTAVDRTRLQQELATSAGHIDSAHERILQVRAEIGVRLQQADSLDEQNGDQSLEMKRRLSEAQDLDYAKAVSDLTRQQLALDAAQKTFTRITGRSLFDLL